MVEEWRQMGRLAGRYFVSLTLQFVSLFVFAMEHFASRPAAGLLEICWTSCMVCGYLRCYTTLMQTVVVRFLVSIHENIIFVCLDILRVVCVCNLITSRSVYLGLLNELAVSFLTEQMSIFCEYHRTGLGQTFRILALLSTCWSSFSVTKHRVTKWSHNGYSSPVSYQIIHWSHLKAMTNPWLKKKTEHSIQHQSLRPKSEQNSIDSQ